MTRAGTGDTEFHETRALAETESRLAERFGRDAPADEIRTLVQSYRHRFASARIRTFVPLLVEHLVSAELRARKHNQARV